ncbi:MAG: hypothetical protein R3F54_31960 [Alphaproteobacteria bacterium]
MSEDEQIQKMEELRQAIAEQLPLGSSPEQVEAFIQAQGIEDYSTSGPTTGADSSLKRERPDLVEQVRYTTAAAIRDVHTGFWASEDIHLRFYYGQDRTLVWSIVRSVATGP